MTALGLAAIFLVLMIAGVLAVVQNARVKDAAVYALTHDVEIEDEAEDIRLLALELQHQHRNLLLGGLDAAVLADLDATWEAFDREISNLVALDVTGLDIPPPALIRSAADRYWSDFRSSVDENASPEATRGATLTALERLDDIEDIAHEIDATGTELTANGLLNVQQAATVERTFIAILLGSTIVAGVVLAVSASRVFRQLQAAWSGERAARQELARALKTKKDFIADASHELRTPLSVIRGNADLARRSESPADLAQSIDRIVTEADHMTKLVEDLLFLARSDAGAPSLELEYLPARWLAARIASRATALAERRGVCLDPDIGCQGFLEADPGRIEQAVLALVDNAAKHSPSGACVRLRADAANGALRFTVEDDGPGIPAAELPMVFDRFYQVGPRRGRKTGGVGLGLPIARSIADAHGGRIDAASAPGAGTRMVLTIPLAAAPEPDDGDIPAESAAVAGGAR